MQCEGIEEESEGISLSIPLSPIARAQAAARAPSYLPPSAPEVVSLSLGNRLVPTLPHICRVCSRVDRGLLAVRPLAVGDSVGHTGQQCLFAVPSHWPVFICSTITKEESLNTIYYRSTFGRRNIYVFVFYFHCQAVPWTRCLLSVLCLNP